jgi:hypothetical protein
MADSFGSATPLSDLHSTISSAHQKLQSDLEKPLASGRPASKFLEWHRELSGIRGRGLQTTNSTLQNELQPPGSAFLPSIADINMTLLRWGSILVPPLVDWRLSLTVNTPVFDQGSCSSCWLLTTSDIISMKLSLLLRVLFPVSLSPQYMCDCGFHSCCSGGWPEWAFLFVQSNKGAASLSSYPYTAKDNQKCKASSFTQLYGPVC